MKKRVAVLSSLVFPLLATSYVAADTPLLQAAIDGDHRTPAYVQRDQYRNPLKTLDLFDVQPNHTVVEIWPGGGWYTEILAPYLKSDGKLIAAQYDANDTQAGYRPSVRKRYEEKLAKNSKVYGDVEITSLMFDESQSTLAKGAADPNSVDRVVTFRGAHGLVHSKTLEPALSHFFDILKPGGKLGIVQHQADNEQDWLSKNIGYIGREYLINKALAAGFVLEAEGFFNQNPKDSRRYEQGVWQLPPTLRNSKTDAEKAKYRAIGESNRMTLVFVKPS